MRTYGKTHYVIKLGYPTSFEWSAASFESGVQHRSDGLSNVVFREGSNVVPVISPASFEYPASFDYPASFEYPGSFEYPAPFEQGS